MPKLRNTTTGAIVNVSEAKADLLGTEWVPADGDKPKQRAPKKSTASKPDAE